MMMDDYENLASVPLHVCKLVNQEVTNYNLNVPLLPSHLKKLGTCFSCIVFAINTSDVNDLGRLLKINSFCMIFSV